MVYKDLAYFSKNRRNFGEKNVGFFGVQFWGIHEVQVPHWKPTVAEKMMFSSRKSPTVGPTGYNDPEKTWVV